MNKYINNYLEINVYKYTYMYLYLFIFKIINYLFVWISASLNKRYE